MKIAVYSGSFNPLHIGHKAIMEYLVGKMNFDMVYLVVSPQSPFKDAGLASTGRARYDAACRALERHPGLKVKADPIELDMPAPQYTVKTLDALSEREPGNSFTLVMGADNLSRIQGWKEYRRILEEYGVAVFPRKGFDLQEIKCRLEEEGRRNGAKYRIQLMDAPTVDVSSTEIREKTAAGENVDRLLM